MKNHLTVRHDKFTEILERMELDQKDIRCIKSLYWNQTASVKVDGKMTERVKICRVGSQSNFLGVIG